MGNFSHVEAEDLGDEFAVVIEQSQVADDILLRRRLENPRMAP